MRTYTYTTQGTCSRTIEIAIDNDGLIADVRFVGGCHGNLQGIAALIKGMKPAEVAARVEGIRCGNKLTSCPDQLTKALRAVEAGENR